MKLKNILGREIYKNCDKYRIKWDSKSRSKYQFQVKQFLKEHWSRHIVYEEFPVFGTRMTLDFFNHHKRIAIEVQGEFHLGLSKFAHNGSSTAYWGQLDRDRRKAKWCESNGIELVEIFPDDLPLTKEFFKNLGISL